MAYKIKAEDCVSEENQLQKFISHIEGFVYENSPNDKDFFLAMKELSTSLYLRYSGIS